MLGMPILDTRISVLLRSSHPGTPPPMDSEMTGQLWLKSLQ